ncbi:hypothetical protein [Desulfovibrio ferrophilus]|uniref:Ser/Thr protein kinase n=1 Tax=Desulfovibrio ferrophilus TaxID=241368 RepID=A0A2Z6AZ62_9BACT|nr:hypothetical protein [Desulfovibrio ferrophilus]BBD08557.1 ser/Thr protein kinase [Desulfovibrio ferrophilus]
MRTRELIIGLLVMACAIGVSGCGGNDFEAPRLMTEGLANPCGLAFDGRGRLYVAEAGKGRVLALGHGDERVTVADNIEQLAGVEIDRDNKVLVISRSRGEVLSIGPRGEQTVLVSGLNEPQGLLAERFGGLLIFEGGRGRVLRLGRDGTLREAVSPQEQVGAVSPAAWDAADSCADVLHPGIRFGTSMAVDPVLMAVAPSGAVYVADQQTKVIRSVTGSGYRRFLVPDGQDVTGMACDRDGNLFYCTMQGRIYWLPRP